jgi:hypothetical protein
VLDDDTYRFLLKARILWNHWDGKLQSILAMWKQMFPGQLLVMADNQNMTVSVYIAGAFSSIMQDLIQNGYIIPRSQGVLYNVSFPELPMLGFDRNDSIQAGLDLGHFPL